MRLLFLTKYNTKGASSRLRFFQFFEVLENKKIDIRYSPLFSNSYLTNLYNNKVSYFQVVWFYLKRFFLLFSAYKYDKLIIEKELFPYMPSFAEKILYLCGIKYIVDFDDAIFHNYDLNKNSIIKFLLKKKINSVMKHSYHVIAGNTYLAKKAEESGAKNISVIPTVIDIKRYNVNHTKKSSKIIIGWTGSPSTFKYIKNIASVLEQLVIKYGVQINIIGANQDLGFKQNVSFINWSEKSEVENIMNFDIGIMPLTNTPWELGKCSYKLIQYMGVSKPVVASPIGMNIEVVKEGVNGFLAKTDEEWFAKLENLILDKNMREELGYNGLQSVREQYFGEF